MIKSNIHGMLNYQNMKLQRQMLGFKTNSYCKKILESKGLADKDTINNLLNGTPVLYDPMLMSDMEKAIA